MERRGKRLLPAEDAGSLALHMKIANLEGLQKYQSSAQESSFYELQRQTVNKH